MTLLPNTDPLQQGVGFRCRQLYPC